MSLLKLSLKSGITKVIRIDPLRHMNICTKMHANSFCKCRFCASRDKWLIQWYRGKSRGITTAVVIDPPVIVNFSMKISKESIQKLLRFKSEPKEVDQPALTCQHTHALQRMNWQLKEMCAKRCQPLAVSQLHNKALNHQRHFLCFFISSL